MLGLSVGLGIGTGSVVSGGGGGGTTFNPADKATPITLTNTNLTASNVDGTYEGVRGTTSHASGKWYFECSIQDSTTLTQIGVANATASLTDFLGADTNSAGYFNNSGGAFFNGAQQTSGNTFTTGSVIGVAIDITNNLIWFAVGNVWFNAGGGGNPSTGTGGMSITGIGTAFPAFNAKSGQATLKPTPASQTFSPPTGFTAWG